MNIFVLNLTPKVAATMHCDKHVVKMPLESAQMICAVGSKLGIEVPYKPTHLNHPCTLWAGESAANMFWLCELLKELNSEWRYRYGHMRDHKSFTAVQSIIPVLLNKLPDIPMTSFAQCMPDQYKHSDPVQAYNNYYAGDKQHLLQYTKRENPYANL